MLKNDSDNDDNWINSSYINNENVTFEELLLDDINDDNMIRVSSIQRYGINTIRWRNGGSDIIFRKGLIFDSKKQLVEAVGKHAIKPSW